MKLRALFVFALVLTVGVVGAWIWFGREINPEPVPSVPAVASSPEVAKTGPTGVAPNPAVPASSTPVAGPESSPLAPPPLSTPVAPVRITSSVMPGMPAVRSTTKPAPPVVAGLPAPNRAPKPRPDPQATEKADLESVQSMLRDFRTRLGGNPVGSNAEIMKSVMGENQAKAILGPPPGQSLSEQGELLDRWGTPYFFHQLSKTSMEIRSAGPDRVMYTGDDLVTQ